MLIQVYTQDTKYGIRVVHAAHAHKVTRKGCPMYWLNLWAKVRPQIGPRRVLVIGDANSTFHVTDRRNQRPIDTVYRTTCSTLGLVDLRQLVNIPDGTWSSVAGKGSRIDTAALTKESSLHVSEAYYWPSTILSDHHYLLLLRFHVPVIRVEKPRKQCNPRLPEAHMPPVHLTVSQQLQYATPVQGREQGDPDTDSRGFIRQLQAPMYHCPEERKCVKVRCFNGVELEELEGRRMRPKT